MRHQVLVLGARDLDAQQGEDLVQEAVDVGGELRLLQRVSVVSVL
jgi:hypothetical protein